MKELTSSHDDFEKRLAIFFGLGAFLMSALVGLLRGYTLEGFLLQGIVVLTLATVSGYLFGVWLRGALAATKPEENLPAGTERMVRNAETLEEGSLVVPAPTETVVLEEEAAQPKPFTFESFDASEIPSAPAPAPAATSNAPAATPSEEEDLPPPPVPAWLK